MTSQFSLPVLVQYAVLLSLLKGLFFCPLVSMSENTTRSISGSNRALFNSPVLKTVKTLFVRGLLQNEKNANGQKKSTIETAEADLHVKIDPREFGEILLNKARQNAARKSDIYMNKAIDATALGVAVLKLIFGKDAKLVMKDAKNSDVQASLRTEEFRPQITSWAARPDKKTFSRKWTSNPRKTDKISHLNINILKLVKSLHPAPSLKSKSENSGNTTLYEQTFQHSKNKKNYAGELALTRSESNLARLLSLIEETQKSTKQENGEKKSWVLLRVPTKQPVDELGMLNDPNKTDESDSDDSDYEVDKKNQQKQQADDTEENRHLSIDQKQQTTGSKRPASITTSPSETSKSESAQAVNPVKMDTTPEVSYEDSVRNLLKALQTTRIHEQASNAINEKAPSVLHQKVEPAPEQNIEEHAASKDTLSGSANTGQAVVSLDALRRLGEILGLSAQRSDDNISPYTGTKDTLTLATPMSVIQGLIATTPPPTPAPQPQPPATIVPPNLTTKSSLQLSDSQETNLNRISEQLKMFAERGLRAHNEYRSLHHAGPLKWSEDLASAAEKLAYQAAKKGSTTRSELVEKKDFGENVAKISNVALEDAGEEAVRHWYNERENFTFSDPDIGKGTKAFTQVIWKNTQTVGMGAAKDDDTGELYVVALYNPGGNDEGKLRENVQSDGKDHTDVYASIFKKSNPFYHNQ